MSLSLLLQIHITSLAILATIMLGLGQGSPVLPLVMALAGSVSLVFTDCLGWFRLHRMIANVAMILSAAFALSDFFRTSSDQQLLAIAKLLIYVQIVLLFQRKNFRIQGQLAVFSLLQVVVAALLNEGLEFGVMLVIFMLIALSTLTLFTHLRELDHFEALTAERRQTSSKAGAARPAGPPPPRVILRPIPAVAPLAWSVVGQTVGIWLATLVFAACFFYGVPRTSGSAWKQGGVGKRSVVGFAAEVSFDDMGRILQSDELVMRVTFHDARSGEPYIVIGQPYFRGAVLTHYLSDGLRSRWRPDVMAVPGLGDPISNLAPESRELVRQDVFLEPTSEPFVFSVFPVYGTAGTPPDLRFQRENEQLVRELSMQLGSRQYRYVFLSTGFRFGTQVDCTPHSNRRESTADRLRQELELRRLRTAPDPRRFSRLISVAQEVVARRGAQGDSVAIAHALEDHFLERNAYRYSLDLTSLESIRDPKADPIEDFVGNHRTGHCEFFASALVLMLRSQGIPARLAVGYRGGDYNYVGNYFLVRQRHAHAWVEAYLERNEIPANSLPPQEIHDGGAWLRLDPTPASDAAQGELGLFDRITNSFDYAQWLWNDYVLRLTPDRQLAAFSQPADAEIAVSLAQLLEEQGLPGVVVGLWKRTETGPAAWIRPVLGGIGVAGSGAALVWLILRMRSWFRRSGRRNLRRGRTVPVVAFYARYERLVRPLGLRRSPSQTQREFGQRAGAQLAAACGDPQAANLSQQIVEAFYQVRFGQVDWAPDQAVAVDALLSRLEQLAADARRKSSHRRRS